MTTSPTGAEPTRALDGQSVLIFGGTSGIGLATALHARSLGADVVVVGSDEARSRQVGEQHGLEWRAADVTEPTQIERAFRGISSVDHLVLLAGNFIVGKVMDTPVSTFRRAFDERIWAAVHTLQLLGDRLAATASITLVSGVATDRASGDGTAVIAAACGAIEVFGRHLALELAPRRVNTVSPGPIDSPLLEKAFGSERAGVVSHLSAQVPLGRIGTVDEAAAAVIFLMSNTFVNGSVLAVDGGMNLT